MIIIAPARSCPACRDTHPPGTTCIGGWAPWDGSPYVPRTPPTVIELTDDELSKATARAEHIVSVDTGRGWQVKFNTGSETRLDINVRGFAAEIAAARATGLRLNWGLLGDTYRRRDKPPDIGRRTEVRNAVRSNGLLWADPRERRDWTYLLVTGSRRRFVVAGWVEGRELMQTCNWREPPIVRYAGFFLPQSELRPLPMPDDA